jgi:Mg2+-importing ATPase
VDRIVLGSELDAWSDAQLADAAETTPIFAKLAPVHKERIIAALRGRGHVVGFMGDGINDAAALKAADVGISAVRIMSRLRRGISFLLLSTANKEIGPDIDLCFMRCSLFLAPGGP